MSADEIIDLLTSKEAVKACAACGCDNFTIRTLDLCPLGYPCSKSGWQTVTITCNKCGLIRHHDLEVLKKGGDKDGRAKE